MTLLITGILTGILATVMALTTLGYVIRNLIDHRNPPHPRAPVITALITLTLGAATVALLTLAIAL